MKQKPRWVQSVVEAAKAAEDTPLHPRRKLAATAADRPDRKAARA